MSMHTVWENEKTQEYQKLCFIDSNQDNIVEEEKGKKNNLKGQIWKICWCPQKGMRLDFLYHSSYPRFLPALFVAWCLMSGAFPQKITRKVTKNTTLLCEFAFQGTRLTHKMPTEFFNQAKKILPLEAVPITKPREVRFF